MALWLAACSSDGPSTSSNVVELEIGSGDTVSAKRIQGEISEVAEVDLYHVRANERDRILQIKCTSDTSRSDVDLLVHVYEKNENGELVMIAGDHAPVDSRVSVTVKVDVPIDEPKDLYVHVRDLMDDDSGKNRPYYISAYYKGLPDGNGSFATAVDLVMNGDAARDSIDSEDDGDCFRVTATVDGVYDIFVDFDRLQGSAVRLNITLYNGDGDIVEIRKMGTLTESHLMHYLPAGEYIAVVTEDGKDEFDTSSFYTISVDQVVASEIMDNDSPLDATAMGDGMFQNAAIDYFEDEDIYEIDSSVPGDIKILDLTFSSDSDLAYRLELRSFTEILTGLDLTSEIVDFSHDYDGGPLGDGTYQVAMKLDTSRLYFLVVRAASGADVSESAPYTADVDVTGIADADESVVHGDGHIGNDVDHNAIDLTAQPEPAEHTGKIAYRTDVDYYMVTVPANASRKQVLSFNLDIPDTDLVQYAMKITKAGVNSFEKTVFNSGEDQRTVDLKTSFLVPESSTDSVYYVKVYDFQDDNGEDAEFHLSWNVTDVAAAPGICPKDNTTTVYHDENDEDDFTSSLVITYPNTQTGTFKYNDTVFDLDSASATQAGSNPVVVSLPWVSGYIDYQGDEDWYSLDLSQPLVNGDLTWYYTISVELYANGSPVEYTWEYMPNSNGIPSNENGMPHVSTEWCSTGSNVCPNGIMGSDGDTSLASELVNLSLMSTDHMPVSGSGDRILWVGRGSSTGSIWSGKVFFRISDFNFLRTGTSPNFVLNPNPDADWGYTAPYYFRLTVKYFNDSLVP